MIQNAPDTGPSAAVNAASSAAAQGATADARSLDNLHDIVVPAPSPFWPPANGWYVFLAIAAVLAVLLLVLALHRWWSRRYRRAAIRELNELRQRSRQTPVPETIAQVDSLLKRVALAAWPRESVASLSSERWVQFLKSSQPTSKSQGSSNAAQPGWPDPYLNLVYSRKMQASISPDQLEGLFGNAENWIRRHDAESIVTHSADTESRGVDSRHGESPSSAGENP